MYPREEEAVESMHVHEIDGQGFQFWYYNLLNSPKIIKKLTEISPIFCPTILNMKYAF